MSDDTKQDALAVASILEALFARLHAEYASLKIVWIFSDNAKCYQNDILSVILLFIGNTYAVTFRCFIHLETQHGKGIGDAHFAVGMRHVKIYMYETCDDVANKSQCFTVMSCDGGLASTTV